ncbi:MAG: hypothetical protein CSB47_07090 [Proteobacteria bacterium]|nr:MAG: hypothetical protein CSB47_07090 [Pseudomonadota bacterium]
MKRKVWYLASMLALSGAVFASTHYVAAALDKVYIVDTVYENWDRSPRHRNYQLVWDEQSRKLELHEGEWQRPLDLGDHLLFPPDQPVPDYGSKELAI